MTILPTYFPYASIQRIASMLRMEQSIFDLKYWFVLGTTLHVLAFIGVCLHALHRRRNASATILWIFVAWSLPLFGPLLYLSFGIDRVSIKGLKTKAIDQLVMQQRHERHQDNSSFIAWHFDHRSDLSTIENSFARKLNMSFNALIPEHPLIDGSNVTPLISGDQSYPLMLQAIQTATHHIHLQSFIIGNDDTSRKFLDALKTKAEEGVKVRVMFDRFGSTHAVFGGLFRKYKNIPNLDIQGWTQANPLKRQFQINLRNHRKNLVIDGKTAFFGGVNLGSDNLTQNGHLAIRDYHFKVEGPFVHELQYSFMRDWFFMTEEPLNNLLCSEHFPKLPTCGAAKARIIDSGPSAPPEMLGEAYFNAIVMAQEQVLIATPYLVPTNDILKALRSAARRGVDVCIMLPEKNNHRYAGLASKALYEELLESGARIFHRKPPFIHAKAMIIDDCVALVGTSNLDVRSLELNYETTVLIYDESAVNQLKLIIHEDLEMSSEINLNEWIQRSSIHKLGENLCSLMTPVL
jgi:cardiolipin synthase